jgi:hypothetical protein
LIELMGLVGCLCPVVAIAGLATGDIAATVGVLFASLLVVAAGYCRRGSGAAAIALALACAIVLGAVAA